MPVIGAAAASDGGAAGAVERVPRVGGDGAAVVRGAAGAGGADVAADETGAGADVLPFPGRRGGDDISGDRLPWRRPRTLPPPRGSAERVRFGLVPPDPALMRRVLDGLHELD